MDVGLDGHAAPHDATISDCPRRIYVAGCSPCVRCLGATRRKVFALTTAVGHSVVRTTVTWYSTAILRHARLLSDSTGSKGTHGDREPFAGPARIPCVRSISLAIGATRADAVALSIQIQGR